MLHLSINKWIFATVVAIVIAGVTTRAACADKRKYVWTYEYFTMEEGEGEIEQYFTFSSPEAGSLKGKTTAELQLEYEVGMSDRFDFSVYSVFKQKPDENLQFDGFKFRWRYRLGEKNQYPVDPLLYMEYKGKPDFSSEHGIEFKLILAKDWGPWNLALNPQIEWEREDGQWDTLPKYTAGLSYQPIKLLAIGVEVVGSREGTYWGPVISHGKNNLWVAVGSAFHIGDVDDGKPETQIRMIFGYEVG